MESANATPFTFILKFHSSPTLFPSRVHSMMLQRPHFNDDPFSSPLPPPLAASSLIHSAARRGACAMRVHACVNNFEKYCTAIPLSPHYVSCLSFPLSRVQSPIFVGMLCNDSYWSYRCARTMWRGKEKHATHTRSTSALSKRWSMAHVFFPSCHAPTQGPRRVCCCGGRSN